MAQETTLVIDAVSKLVLGVEGDLRGATRCRFELLFGCGYSPLLDKLDRAGARVICLSCTTAQIVVIGVRMGDGEEVGVEILATGRTRVLESDHGRFGG